MIYTAFGLPVFKIISGNIKENTVKLLAYGGEKNGLEEYERTVNELKADGGWLEIKGAIENLGSYKPTTEQVVNFFNEFCK